MPLNETKSDSKSQTLELSFEKLVYGGEALARSEAGVVLVPFAAPGDRARVDVAPAKGGVRRGKLQELLYASTDRSAPDCPYFQRCGGCHYQHIVYAAQTRFKLEILREVLRRVGKIDAPERIDIVSGPEWGYRNRIQLHMTQGRLGYLEAGSHILQPVERCPIASPKLNDAIAGLSKMARDRRFPDFLQSVELFTNETEVQLNVRDTARPLAKWFFDWAAESIPGLVTGAIEYSVGDTRFRVSHQAFFQVNRFLVEPLVETALRDAGGQSAIDLYAGVGLFSLAMARRFSRVMAVESGNAAIRDIEHNAARAGLELAALDRTAEDFLTGLEVTPDFVLADPPRAGLSKPVIQRLIQVRPPQLTLVSCDTATLARDLSTLLAGGYRIGSMTLIDLFPQTYHIETVARLTVAS